MFREYVEAAMRRAKYETLDDDGSFFGRIPGVRGVWSNADTLEECRTELAEVLDEWLVLRLSEGLPIPTIGGIKLRPGKIGKAKPAKAKAA